MQAHDPVASSIRTQNQPPCSLASQPPTTLLHHRPPQMPPSLLLGNPTPRPTKVASNVTALEAPAQ